MPHGLFQVTSFGGHWLKLGLCFSTPPRSCSVITKLPLVDKNDSWTTQFTDNIISICCFQPRILSHLESGSCGCDRQPELRLLWDWCRERRKEPVHHALRPTQGPVSTPASGLAFSKLLVTLLFKALPKVHHTHTIETWRLLCPATGVTAALPTVASRKNSECLELLHQSSTDQWPWKSKIKQLWAVCLPTTCPYTAAGNSWAWGFLCPACSKQKVFYYRASSQDQHIKQWDSIREGFSWILGWANLNIHPEIYHFKPHDLRQIV